MLLFLSIVFGFAIGFIRRGNFFRLAELRGLWFAILPLASGILMKAWPAIPLAPKALLTSLAYMGVLVFVFQNRSFFFSALFLGLGTLSNYLVIAANSFRMPVAEKALAMFPGMTPEAVLAQRADYFVAVEGARLLFLGDIFYFPLKPLDGFFSIGDVLLALGVFFLIVQCMGKNTMPRKKPAEKEN